MGALRQNVWILLLFVHSVLSFEYDLPSSYYNDGELISSSVVCRHADRNIQLTYKNDPWKSEEFWPFGYGELTNIGKRSHYKLGQYFRERYASIIPDGRPPLSIVKIKSSDVDRVLMSAQANLAGLFPPTGDQIWNADLLWQPFPISTLPTHEDYLLATAKRCDHYDYVMVNYLNQSNYQRLFKVYGPTIKFLEQNSGEDLSTLQKLLTLRDALYVEQHTGKCLPEWAEIATDPPSDLEYLTAIWYQIHTATDELKKIKSGFLLKEILDQFSDKLDSKLPANQTLWLYFGHDVTIANMLHSLGFFEPPFSPLFAACVLFDLHKVNGTSQVRVFYKPSPDHENQQLKLPECGYGCTLEDMYSVYNNILPTDTFENECKLRDGEVYPPGGSPEGYTSLL